MSSDPSDLQPGANPSPSPSTDGGNALSSSPVTSPIAIGTTTTPVKQNVGAPPATFVAAVNNAINYRLGYVKAGLIPASDRTALVAKLWQDPQLSQYFITNQNNLKDPNIAGTLGVQINNVLLGQGNDPSVVSDYTNMLQAAGVQLTTGEQAALSGATQAVNAPVPRPFGTATVSGYDYGVPMPAGGWSSKAPGESFGWQTHNGVDYGTHAGDRIVSPFAGTVVSTTGAEGYGNIVYVQLDNGWVMGFGHVGQGTAQTGTRVNPGDLIAIAGANVGSSEGSVTIVTWQAPGGKWKNGVYQGNYDNPHNVLDPIFQGTTFSSLGAAGAAGTGYPTVNTHLDTEYPSIKLDFQTFFGHPPSPEDVMDILQHGSSPAQWTDYIRAMPSHIDGLTQGQYHDMRGVADQVSTKVLGHPSTDGIVAELAQQQLTTPTAVTNWYNEHGSTGIEPSTYNQIYKAVAPIVGGIFNDTGADPRIIKSIYDSGRPERTGPQEG